MFIENLKKDGPYCKSAIQSNKKLFVRLEKVKISFLEKNQALQNLSFVKFTNKQCLLSIYFTM